MPILLSGVTKRQLATVRPAAKRSGRHAKLWAMRFPRAAAAWLTAFTILLAGCGGSSSEDLEPPADFAIDVRHVDGSVPPPDHAEWTLAVDDDAQGKLDYTAGYPGPDTPTYAAQFDVEQSAIDDVYAALVERDLLRDFDDSGGDQPIGGPTVTATVIAEGETYEIPAYDDGEPTLQPLGGRIHRLAPGKVWRDFERRAEEDAPSSAG